MTWTTQPYCTLADVKLALDPALPTNSTEDAFLTGLIPIAQADIDDELGFSFQQDGTVASPATRLYDGTGNPWLWIDETLSITQVLEVNRVTFLSGGNVWQTGTTTTIDITVDVQLRPNNYVSLGIPANKMVRISDSPFEGGKQNYQVTGIFGKPILPNQTYPGVPNDISRACMLLVIHYYKERDTNYADVLSGTGPGMGIGGGGAGKMRYIKQWPVDVQHIIAKYTHRRFITRVY